MNAALTETDAERYLAAHALLPAYPGFVGLAVELPPDISGPSGTSRLRHGFRTAATDHVLISGPPSPGLEIAVERMAEDLGADQPVAAVRVSLEAGTDDQRLTSVVRRWAVAQAIAPILTAAFANPSAPAGQHPVVPLPASPDPRAAWARQVLDAPAAPNPTITFRQWIRHGGARPTIADLQHHWQAFRPPVAARGYLEVNVTDRLPGDGWLVAAAVTTTLIEDPQAAAEALIATSERPTTPYGRERPTLADADIAAAARSLFLAAYAALARRGAPRQMRDALADYFERHLGGGAHPVDDISSSTTDRTRTQSPMPPAQTTVDG